MCSVVGSNDGVDSDVSVSSESEDAMSDSAQSSGVFEVFLPPPTTYQDSFATVDSDVRESYESEAVRSDSAENNDLLTL